MDNEKIKKLVQSYVDELFAHDDMTEQENIEAKNDAFVMCMAFVGHILETNCIVEKEQVKRLYKEHRDESQGLEKGCREWFFYYGRKDLMKTLFGKELFNDTEK